MPTLSLRPPAAGHPCRSLPDLDEFVLDTVVEAILANVPSEPNQAPVAVPEYCARQPFVLAAICRHLRQFMMSRGAFWSQICINDRPKFNLIEASIERSQSAPLNLDISQTFPESLNELGPDALRRLGVILRRSGPRLASLTMNVAGMDIFKFLETEHERHCTIPGGIPELRFSMSRFTTAIQPIHFVGPRTTTLDIHIHTITPLELVDLLKACSGLKTLRLGYLSFDADDEEIEVALEAAKKAAGGKRDTQSLTHLMLFMPSDLEPMLKIISTFFPMTTKAASFVHLVPGAAASANEYTIVESHLDLTKVQGHNSRNVSLAVGGTFYELVSADEQLRRRFTFTTPALRKTGSPGRATVLGLLQRVVSFDLELNPPRSILQWIDLWRRETFPELRSIVVHLTVDLTGDSPSSTILESAEQNSLKITAPRLEKVTFEWEVTGLVHGHTYGESDPTVQAWARLCRVVLGSFASTTTVKVEACSTRELTLPPSLIKKAISSC